MSSPGTYLRYSANSTLDPLCGLRCWPDMLPDIGRRACNWLRESRASTTGSRKSCLLCFTPWRPCVSHFKHPCGLFKHPCGLHLGGVRAGFLDETLDDFAAGDALGLGMEARQDAVHEHRFRKRLDILDARQVTPLQCRAGLGPENQVLHGARSRAPCDKVLDPVGRTLGVGPRTAHQTHDEVVNMVRHGHAAHEILKLDQLLPSDRLCDLYGGAAGGFTGNAAFLGKRGIAHVDQEHEPV